MSWKKSVPTFKETAVVIDVGIKRIAEKKLVGDVEFESLKDGIVTVRMLGACADCLSINETLKDGIEALILDEVPGITEVRLSSTSLF